MVIKHVIYNIIIGIICFCLGLVISFKSKPKIQYIPIDKEIRDSLYIVNDSIQYKIKYITKRYYEKRDSIISNDSSADMRFFTEYINNYQRTNKDR